uniref:Uncharacterized protein n=1 Tax=Mantoniella antarctica TaxID=81844 RepID=A0A7S0SD41_9CHLO|mmetsp:Transcript_18126/g.44989  ORF Transcript_18126/g.44989 Transcript_18126/m.44989 type:complete len:382 (+) Transcript_18126:396-1541(+)
MWSFHHALPAASTPGRKTTAPPPKTGSTYTPLHPNLCKLVIQFNVRLPHGLQKITVKTRLEFKRIFTDTDSDGVEWPEEVCIQGHWWIFYNILSAELLHLGKIKTDLATFLPNAYWETYRAFSRLPKPESEIDIYNGGPGLCAMDASHCVAGPVPGPCPPLTWGEEDKTSWEERVRYPHQGGHFIADLCRNGPWLFSGQYDATAYREHIDELEREFGIGIQCFSVNGLFCLRRDPRSVDTFKCLSLASVLTLKPVETLCSAIRVQLIVMYPIVEGQDGACSSTLRSILGLTSDYPEVKAREETMRAGYTTSGAHEPDRDLRAAFPEAAAIGQTFFDFITKSSVAVPETRIVSANVSHGMGAHWSQVLGANPERFICFCVHS